MMIATLDRASCPCTNTGPDVWCRYRAMTDIWREMMHEKIISEVNSLKFNAKMPDIANKYISWLIVIQKYTA